MALQTSLRRLQADLQTLHDCLAAARITVVEDKPLDDDVVLVDLFGNALDDLLGWLEGTREASTEAVRAAIYPENMQHTWRALLAGQERFHRLQQQYRADVANYERLVELMEFGQQRGGEWESWAASVRDALLDSRQPVQAVEQALFACWQEIGERLSMGALTVQASAVAHQTAPPSTQSLRSGRE